MTDSSCDEERTDAASGYETVQNASAESRVRTADDDTADIDAAATLDAEAAIASIRERATAIRDRELETALARLEGGDDLSATEREAVEELADRLVARLLAVPEASLREAAASDDDETVETAASLFGRGRSPKK